MSKRIQVIVVAAIKKNGEYLLTRRHDPKNKLVHKTWQIPGGGLEFSESISECLHREIKEETGIDIEVIAPIPFVHEKIIGTWHGVAIGFLCKPKRKNPVVTIDKEATDFGWFTFEKIKKLTLHHGTLDFLTKAEEFEKNSGGGRGGT